MLGLVKLSSLQEIIHYSLPSLVARSMDETAPLLLVNWWLEERAPLRHMIVEPYHTHSYIACPYIRMSISLNLVAVTLVEIHLIER